jgi:ABC-type spermidine/putrescine transport system permease subunit I
VPQQIDRTLISNRRMEASRGAAIRVGIRQWGWRFGLLSPVLVVFAAFLIAPLGFMVSQSFGRGLGGYEEVLTSPLLRPVVVNTIEISLVTTAIALILGYLLAAVLWRGGAGRRVIVTMFVLLPFWTGIVVKTFAWSALLQANGPIAVLLEHVGLQSQATGLLHTKTAIVIGLVHFVLPYAVLPIFLAMVQIQPGLERTSASLGASNLQTAWHVVLPLTLPGAYASALLVFIISAGAYVTPVLLGGPRDVMVSTLIGFYLGYFADYVSASALSVLVACAVLGLIAVYQLLPKPGQFA